MSHVHEKALQGYSVGSGTYARGRPEYPDGLTHWLTRDLALDAGKTMLDLGAGTGKFIPLLRNTGARVCAVEPVPEMLARLKSSHPDVEAALGTAEAIPLPDASVDAVVCAQAFHWFSTAAALAEVRRVLKPGGKFGLVWNVRDETVAWVKEWTRIVEPYSSGVPRYWTMEWQAVFPADGFGPLVERSYPHGHTGSAEDVIVNRALSVSFIAALPTAEQQRVADALRHLVATAPELAGKPVVTYPYVTKAFHCERLA